MEEILKLERLKLPTAAGTSTSDDIIQQISRETGATIRWEAGCKTPPIRKEPCIKISGSEEKVKKAKEMLLERMEIQSNRVVMKMDVSHFEHPSLIGKGGKLIKKVMDSTGCHIHFPDANIKSCGLEKSNHVSIYGDPMNVERARVMLRALIPIQIYFEIPATNLEFSQECKYLSNHLGLMIYSAPGQNGTTLIVIRCNQDQFLNLRKEITTIMEFICGTNGANLPSVNIRTDIVQYHQAFVKGFNCSNVEAMMKRTGAEITFPHMNANRSERSSVKISGNLDCVYMAWQEIMNLLPVSVSFDVTETRDTKGEYMDFLRDCGITVYNRPKPKYYIKNVTVKGPEKYSKQMLQYRQHLLRLPSLNFKPDIEDINLASNFLSSLTDYHSPNVIPSSVSSLVSKNLLAEISQFTASSVSNTNIVSNNLLAEISQLTDFYMQSNSPPICSNSPPICSNSPPICSNSPPICSNSPPICSTRDQNYIKALVLDQAKLNENVYSFDSNSPGKSSDYFMSNNWLKNTPPASVDQAMADFSLSPSSLSPNHGMENKGSPDSCNLFMNEKSSESLAEDYYRKKVLAAKAMRRPIKSMKSAQVPSSLWAGYGFSQSMPASVINKDNLATVNQYYCNYNNNGESCSSSEDSEGWENVVLKDCLDGNIWSNNEETMFSHSNYFDFLSNMPVPFDYITKDILPELLWQYGLHKYIDIFTKEEIDYHTFLHLTDKDLRSLGIGHQYRKKFICLIRELQDAKPKLGSKKFDAAPGAERKMDSF